MKKEALLENSDSATKKSLLKAAKEEFLEKGYQEASLRSICKKAGVTTGALYFFFKGKNALFESLVAGVSRDLVSMLQEHFAFERVFIKSGKPKEGGGQDMGDDLFAGKKIFSYMYSHYDQITLLLKKSKGSVYENFTDKLVAITEKQNSLATAPLGKQVTHWVSHMQINSFIHIFTHVKSEKQALEMLPYVMEYLKDGFYGMVGLKEKIQ